jgi:hypothetical protein
MVQTWAASRRRSSSYAVQTTFDLVLHPKQIVAKNTSATEVLYGGAAGGGKSHLMRVAAIEWCYHIPNLQVYLFRRIYDDLVKNHMEGRGGFRALLAPLTLAGQAHIVESEIRFKNGSKIFLCHCEHEKHIYKYQGSEMDVLLIDEITHFSETMYRFLRGRLRQVGLEIPEQFESQYTGMFPRIMVSGNPGNIGHLWVKKAWIEGKVKGREYPMPAREGGMKRIYIPARLDDNPSLMEADPNYEARLEGLGSKALVEALRWGNWDVVASRTRVRFTMSERLPSGRLIRNMPGQCS